MILSYETIQKLYEVESNSKPANREEIVDLIFSTLSVEHFPEDRDLTTDTENFPITASVLERCIRMGYNAHMRKIMTRDMQTLGDLIADTQEVYYERLYKIRGVNKIFRYVSTNLNDSIFSEFEEEDSRFWIEDEPKLVRKV